MKPFYFLGFLLIFNSAFSDQLKPIAQKINDKKERGEVFENFTLFNRTGNSDQLLKTKTFADKATLLHLNSSALQSLLLAEPENIHLVIPIEPGKNMELYMYRSSLFTPDFSVVTSEDNGNAVGYQHGLHYWGIVNGDNSSLVSISIFNDEVMGVISIPSGGNFILGKIKNDPDGNYIFYNDHDLKFNPTLTCSTTGDERIYRKNELENHRTAMTNCIRLYWEINYDIFLDKGTVTATTNYITGLFNESALIYANDNIPVALSQVFVWNNPSPYTASSTPALLGQFQSYRNSFNGDLGNLLGYSGGGGIAAGFSGLCASNLDDSQCYSGISSSYQNYPVYSWSIAVVTHEQGHLMGSRHTHACVWNGNGTAIDGCGPAAGYGYEGSCSGAPIPSQGGTIMSYCHLVSVGMNFSLGFGPQPSAVIINNYNNAGCLSSCSGVFCFTPLNLNTVNVTTTSATFTWDTVPGAINYAIQYRITGTSTWSLDTSSTNSCNATGLTPGTSYEWQVETLCNGGNSGYSPSVNFITIPTVCSVPSGLTVMNITSSSAVLTWNPVMAAVSYYIQYRITGTSVWQLDSTVNTSVFINGLTTDTMYEWQIQTVCVGGGTSSFSSMSNFHTAALGQAVTIVLQPDGECGKDAVIGDCVPCGYDNSNFGTSPEFNAIAWTNGGNISDGRALIQFDITSIPAGSSVQSAYISFYFDSTSSNGQHSTQSGPNDAYIMQIDTPWFENTVTWNNQPTTITANQGYLPASISPTQDYLNIDVTAMTQYFVNNPSLNYGMMLELVTEQYYRKLIFCSSDYPNPARRPKLEITYLPNVSNCISLQYAQCNGIDALVSTCIPLGYDTTNFGWVPETDAIAWTNGGNISNARAFMYWDLSFIPTSATVSSASLSLYAYNSPSNGAHSTQSGPNDAVINKSLGPWNESTITWNNMPSVSTQFQAYLPASINANQDYLNIDVSAMVQDMISNPSTNFGMVLQLVTESYYRKLVFASSDNADPAKYPKLDICYTAPTGIQTNPVKDDLDVIYNDMTGSLHLSSSKNFEPNAFITVYAASGQCVMKLEKLHGKEFTCSLPSLSRGIYFYQVINGKKSTNGKFIFNYQR